MAVIFNFNSCSLLVGITFIRFIEMTPSNAPLYENDPPKQIKILKMTPSKMASPPLQAINGKPPG